MVFNAAMCQAIHSGAGSLVVLGCLLSGCNRQSPSGAKSEPPAKVAQVADEAKLNTITLTAKAEQRLGIRVVPVLRQKVQRQRTLGAEAVVPQGRNIVVAAPVTGTLSIPGAAKIPLPGSQVQQGQTLFHWTPLLTPPERVQLIESRASLSTLQLDAKRQLESAKLEFEAAGVALKRAEQLLADQAGTRRAVDEARAQHSLARETLAGAQARHQLLSQTSLDKETGAITPLEIRAPLSGMLTTLGVTPGQTVLAGSVLFTIVADDPLWIRVPLYAGGTRDVDLQADAVVAEFDELPGRGVPAKPIAAPPTADPLTATVDLYFELANPEHRYRAGQKLAATLCLKSDDEGLVIPNSAIVHDIHGNAWVYERTAPQTYVRRRIVVYFVQRELAVLASGPAEGTKVVAEGAAELFGTEFGFGK